MSVEMLELAARALAPVLGEVVFLGGASISLRITDPGAPEPLPTKDVDVVLAEVTTRGDFYAFEERLRLLGFVEDRDAGLICRFHHRESDLLLDAMPAEASILGLITVGRPRVPLTRPGARSLPEPVSGQPRRHTYWLPSSRRSRAAGAKISSGHATSPT